jgi:hypothetical protein
LQERPKSKEDNSIGANPIDFRFFRGGPMERTFEIDLQIKKQPHKRDISPQQ